MSRERKRTWKRDLNTCQGREVETHGKDKGLNQMSGKRIKNTEMGSKRMSRKREDALDKKKGNWCGKGIATHVKEKGREHGQEIETHVNEKEIEHSKWRGTRVKERTWKRGRRTWREHSQWK